MANQTVRPKFILSAAVGIALALVVGYPVGGWLVGSYAEAEGVDMASFFLAKAGVDRALWQINQEKDFMDAVMKGRAVKGLNGDIDFLDVPGGSYRVKVRYHHAEGEFRILGTGVEAKTGRKQALELLIKKEPNEKGLIQKLWREVPVES